MDVTKQPSELAIKWGDAYHAHQWGESAISERPIPLSLFIQSALDEQRDAIAEKNAALATRIAMDEDIAKGRENEHPITEVCRKALKA